MQKSRMIGQLHRSRTAILTETNKLVKLKQLNFKNGLSNLQSKRVCSTEPREISFALPNSQEQSRRDLPSDLLRSLTLRDNIRTLDCLSKKEGQCKVRQNYIQLINWLKASLEGMERIAGETELTQEAVYEYLNKVYGACFIQIIEQTKAESAEKAEVLRLIWDNVVNLSSWLDKYYRCKLASQTHKHAIRCDEQTRRHLFNIQELQEEVDKLTKQKQRKDKFFYEVVKDNRKLRRHNNKLLVRLKYESDSNNYLKEENLKFYRENEKMKLVISEENRVNQLETLTKRFHELEKNLLKKNKVTRNNVIKEAKEQEIKERLEDEIRMIVKRIDQQDLLDLDYYEPPKVEELQNQYSNIGVQTQRNTESRATNTYVDLEGKKRTNGESQTQLKVRILGIQSNTVHLSFVSHLRKQSQRFSHSPVNVSRTNSKTNIPSKESAFNLSRGIPKPEVEVIPRVTQQEPKTYQERVYRLYTDYESICKTIEGMRMLLINIHQHDRTRIKKDTKTIALKTYNEFKKLLCNSLNLVETKTPVTKRMKTSNNDDVDESPRLSVEEAEKQFHLDITPPTQQLKMKKYTRRRNDQMHIVDITKPNNASPRKSLVGGRLEIPRLGVNGARGSIFKQISERNEQAHIDFTNQLRGIKAHSKTRPEERTLGRQEERISGMTGRSSVLRDLLSQTFLNEQLGHEAPPHQTYIRRMSNKSRMSKIHLSTQQLLGNKQYSSMEVQATMDRPSMMSSNFNEFDTIEQFITAETEQARERPSNITANFVNRQELMKYFRNAVSREEVEQDKSKPLRKVKIVRDTKYKLQGLAKKAGFTANAFQPLAEHNIQQLHEATNSPIASILSKLEQALSKNQKELHTTLRNVNSGKLYTKNVIRRLFNYLIREVYKQRIKLLEKDCDFESFFRDWVINRYGLQDIYETVIAKIKMSVARYADDEPEFKSIATLANCREGTTLSVSYCKGLFRLFVLFVEFGTEANQLLRGDGYNANVTVSQSMDFLQELLKVFLSEEEAQRSLHQLSNKHRPRTPFERVNLFELFLAVECTLDLHSNNPELEQLVAAISKAMSDDTGQVITLEQLLVIWQIINPAQEELQLNILRLVKFCRLNESKSEQKLVIPLYKLSLLARRFGWWCLLRPIDLINKRFQQCYEGKLLVEPVALERELHFLRTRLTEHKQIVGLLDTKMLKHRLWSRSKDGPLEPYPVLLYKLTKLCLANVMFDQHIGSVFDSRLTSISQAATAIGRKQILLSIGRSE